VDHRKIHVVSLTQRSTSKRSVKDSSSISNAADLKRLDEVRRQLKEALRELEQIEFEVQGGCSW
jgi:hypothetical protein